MNLNKDMLIHQNSELSSKMEAEMRQRFRILLREGIDVALRNGHKMRIEKIKNEKTHLWASLICKKCGSILYLDADRKWPKDRIFGTAAMIRCRGKEQFKGRTIS